MASSTRESLETLIQKDINHMFELMSKNYPDEKISKDQIVKTAQTHNGITAELIFFHSFVHGSGIYQLAFGNELREQIYRYLVTYDDDETNWIYIEEINEDWDDIIDVLEKVYNKKMLKEKFDDFSDTFTLLVPHAIQYEIDKGKDVETLDNLLFAAETQANIAVHEFMKRPPSQRKFAEQYAHKFYNTFLQTFTNYQKLSESTV